MGLVFAKLMTLFGSTEYKIVFVGLNNAGKTTTLYKLHLGEVVVTQPTIGSNVEEITHRNIKFQAWDLGGQQATRPSWSTYYVNAHAVCMVVDSTDRERIGQTKEELFSLLSHDDLRSAVLVVFANKQDLKGAMTPAEITDALNLHTIKSHSWHIQACCALTGEGLEEGLDWVVTKIK
eukprot:GFYU01002127.1.p1 GENE.GFYU01002127.1~~GFYU01002127.1.p1  ORF type:complete len:178 (+),score=23.47 GFYU01002127.1:138-671(+)